MDQLTKNKLKDAEAYVKSLGRQLVDADLAEAEQDYDIDLYLYGTDYIRNYEGSNTFVLKLRDFRNKLTHAQVRAALNIKHELGNGAVKTMKCYDCNEEFTKWDDLKAHKVAEHGSEAPPPVIDEKLGHSVAGEAVISSTVATKGLNLENLPDGRYATPAMSGYAKDSICYMTVRRVRRTIRRDRRYVTGKIITGSEVVQAGTIEVRHWSSDSKELVGEQKPGDVYRGHLEQELELVLAEPEAFAKLFGKLQERCCICGKELTDDTSKALGLGFECEKKEHYFTNRPRTYIPDCLECEEKGLVVRGVYRGFMWREEKTVYKCHNGHTFYTNKKGEREAVK